MPTSNGYSADCVQLAKMVSALRDVQKNNGSGYKTPAAASQAKPLEQQVDSQVATILAAGASD